MPGDGEDAIGLDQKPEGTGKPDRSASAPRHQVGVVGSDSTRCMRAALSLVLLGFGQLFTVAVAQERPAASTQSVMLEDLTWIEVRDAIATGKTTAIYYAGSTEQNGPHMVNGRLVGTRTPDLRRVNSRAQDAPPPETSRSAPKDKC